VSVDGYRPAQIATSGPKGPTNLVAVRVKLQPGQSQDVTIHFRMPGEHGQLRVVPSARIPAVSWDGQDTFTETGIHTVAWVIPNYVVTGTGRPAPAERTRGRSTPYP
jgi:hypothetical protein